MKSMRIVNLRLNILGANYKVRLIKETKQ